MFLSPVRDLLGIRYILVPSNVALDRLGLSLEYQAADGRIYRSEAALPRAFVGPARDAWATRRASSDPGARGGLPPGGALGRVRGDATGGQRLLQGHRGDRSLRARARDHHRGERSSRLSRPDRYMVPRLDRARGWTGVFDRTRRYAFRAVRIEPGRHQVEFLYAPGSVRLGFALSALALLAIIGLVAGRGAGRIRLDEP